ncbi:uncharacterized protein LOC117326194 isoform X2 [Pecten maximus]|uniref:uncharacterized protein LOC117326194 isoform X2 n=1 Tax=Pecten maximus TaxID=6579 RepID=UPI001458EBF2|nr:uncharacterized protein LOC117326194 isoform X2 [Pecten maximus]
MAEQEHGPGPSRRTRRRAALQNTLVGRRRPTSTRIQDPETQPPAPHVEVTTPVVGLASPASLPTTQEIIKELFQKMKDEGYIMPMPVNGAGATAPTVLPPGPPANYSTQVLPAVAPGINIPAAASGSPTVQASDMTNIVPQANSGLSMPSVHTNIQQPEHLSNMNITAPLANCCVKFDG